MTVHFFLINGRVSNGGREIYKAYAAAGNKTTYYQMHEESEMSIPRIGAIMETRPARHMPLFFSHQTGQWPERCVGSAASSAPWVALVGAGRNSIGHRLCDTAWVICCHCSGNGSSINDTERVSACSSTVQLR